MTLVSYLLIVSLVALLSFSVYYVISQIGKAPSDLTPAELIEKITKYDWKDFLKDVEENVPLDEILDKCREFGMPSAPKKPDPVPIASQAGGTVTWQVPTWYQYNGLWYQPIPYTYYPYVQPTFIPATNYPPPQQIPWTYVNGKYLYGNNGNYTFGTLGSGTIGTTTAATTLSSGIINLNM